MQKIEIIHEPTTKEPFVIINKPAGLPSAPLYENDKINALSYTEELFPSLKEICGKKQIEHGLIHRLDTQTSGLLLIASSQKFYDFIQNEQIKGTFEKIYTAKCNFLPNNAEKLIGFPDIPLTSLEKIKENNSITIKSFFRNFGVGLKEVRPVSALSGKAATKKCKSNKEYITTIKIIKELNDNFIVKCNIVAGYRHQVRCHLAWIGIPVIGDNIYNFQYKNQKDCNLDFRATELSFINPETNNKMIYNLK